jgi:hypothetical protein
MESAGCRRRMEALARCFFSTVSATEPETCDYCAIAEPASSKQQDKRMVSLGIRSIVLAGLKLISKKRICKGDALNLR